MRMTTLNHAPSGVKLKTVKETCFYARAANRFDFPRTLQSCKALKSRKSLRTLGKPTQLTPVVQDDRN